MARRHGKRRGLVRDCGCRAKAACYSTYEAAYAAVVTTPDAERAYRGSCCGHYHVTRYTQDEFAQRVAAFGVQEAEVCGTVVPSTTEEAHHEGQANRRDHLDGCEPRGDAGRPRAATLERGPGPRLAPSPATVARFLEGRRGA